MEQRISYAQLDENQPVITKALLGLGAAIADSTLENKLIHLVKFRASQINGCEFCLHLHANQARKDGEDTQRLDMLPAWQESPHYSERERQALQLCEALTYLPTSSISEEQYKQLNKVFSEKEIIDLLAVIIEINSWNRVVSLTHMIPSLDS